MRTALDAKLVRVIEIMKFRDYYEVLGVPRDASGDQIKAAYRRLARKYHPDVSKEFDAEARFKEVGEAYDVLRDAEKRASYDQLGANWKSGQDFRPPPGWESVYRESARTTDGASDPFSRFFEDLFRAQKGQHRGSARPAAETLSVSIELDEAFSGAEKQIRISDQGSVATAPRTLKFKIPKGVTDGQKVRLGGQGALGMNGQRGDLLLELSIRPHPLYKVEDSDVTLELPVAPWELALGGTVEVPTLAGRVDLRIPEGTRPGARMRLRGRGLGKIPGDQFVALNLVLPDAESELAREFYTRMRDELDFEPRGDWP